MFTYILLHIWSLQNNSWCPHMQWTIENIKRYAINKNYTHRRILAIRPHTQWESTSGRNSQIEGNGGGWGTSRKIVKYIYFLLQNPWNWLGSLTLATQAVTFSVWIRKIKFTKWKWCDATRHIYRTSKFKIFIKFFLLFAHSVLWPVQVSRPLPVFRVLGGACQSLFVSSRSLSLAPWTWLFLLCVPACLLYVLGPYLALWISLLGSGSLVPLPYGSNAICGLVFLLWWTLSDQC